MGREIKTGRDGERDTETDRDGQRDTENDGVERLRETPGWTGMGRNAGGDRKRHKDREIQRQTEERQRVTRKALNHIEM